MVSNRHVIELMAICFAAGWALCSWLIPNRGPRHGQFWCRLCHRWTDAFICIDHNHMADETRRRRVTM
jgi:hypothetical protein